MEDDPKHCVDRLSRTFEMQKSCQVSVEHFKSPQSWYCLCMDIDLTGFSAAQKQALFDLLILAMYADGHLSSVEDEQLQKLLAGMGFVDEIDRQREFDAAVTRIRPSMQSIYKAKELALADRSKTAHFPEAETSSDADSRHGRYQ
jgi:hypothetical protein